MALSPSSAAAAAAPPLDFEALLSREYRPARVTRLIPREAYHPDKQNFEKPKKKKQKVAGVVGNGDDTAAKKQQQQQEETARLVLSLVTQTPAFTRHLPGEKQEGEDVVVSNLLTTTQQQQRSVVKRSGDNNHDNIPPAFHDVVLGDWESQIDWEGVKEGDEQGGKVNNKDDEEQQSSSKSSSSSSETTTAMALLKRKKNPFLENIRFDESTVSWEGDTHDLLQKAQRAPLILELGVAGQSVARHVYQNTVLSAQRPTPALKSEAYQNRVERDWSTSQAITSTAEVSASAKGTTTTTSTLHADKEKREAEIEARQRKRAQMAKDKTSRVTEAMGTLALGGGRGRTITSSLMGPGGTERTGRPSRQMGSSAAHETIYIEQLDMVSNHGMVRDLSRVMLREFHRPKLPVSVVRQDLAWQFQIRYTPAGKKTAEASGTSSSYQSIMMGTHAGAISKAKLRTEADLTPTEGKLVLLEYSDERPPIQLSKGMASKIVNYYRGDKAHCPVSAGGGDRPARRKRGGGENQPNAKDHGGAAQTGKLLERPPRLEGPNRKTNIMDWVGKLPSKTQKERSEKETIDVLPEGITEILHPKVHGPFIGDVDEGTVLTGLINNLFVAPMFRHEPESTDFLMILTPPGGHARPGQRESMGVVLRDLPSSVFTVGQTEPRVRVHAPNSQGEKTFTGPWISYQIARALSRSFARDGQGLPFDQIQALVCPYQEINANTMRQRVKQVAVYDKNTLIWTSKAIGDEDYPGVDALGRAISPESVTAFETANAASRRLTDLGIHHLFNGTNTVASIGVAMVYLAGQLNATRELSRKTKKLLDLSRSNRTIKPIQIAYYEKAAAELEAIYKMLRQKHDVAQFIYEELQLTPWHLTGEYIDVHKKGEGTGMMKLTGLGDPSGQGEGFSFIREVDSKPSKSVGSGALNAQMKKITGTEDDLRKLTMKQMASLLRSYGMAQKQIDTLKRWDRVHVIRDLSTKAASDGIGDGLERFARGEKLKLSEQKQMYRDRIQVIWRRQIAALSMESGDKAMGVAGTDNAVPTAEGEADAATAPQGAQTKKAADNEKEESDSDSDDDLAATLEEEMMDRSEANQLVAAHAGVKESEGGLGQLRAATQDQDVAREARELASLKRQKAEERAAQDGLQSMRPMMEDVGLNKDRKVIRKRITKTLPDGQQTTTFKFIVRPDEVGKILARKKKDEDSIESPKHSWSRKKEIKLELGLDEKPPGQAMFEDEDDFEYSSKGRLRSHRRRGASKKRKGRTTPRGRNLQIGKLKTKISKEERLRKRKREEEELEVYAASAKRKGTNNRRERGSIRDRRPHVIFAEKLENIRAAVEGRTLAGPFLKPVNWKLIPRYYEVISHPIDLQTIRDKISRNKYPTADAFVRDFELMKSNAIKFNGPENPIAQESVAIYDFVRDQVESSRQELSALEEAAKAQLSGKPKKKKKAGASKKSVAAPSGHVAKVGGVSVNLGDLSKSMLDGVDSDSGESYSGLLSDL